jgi:hypothetical protein
MVVRVGSSSGAHPRSEHLVVSAQGDEEAGIAVPAEEHPQVVVDPERQ